MEETQQPRSGKVQGNWKCSHCNSEITELPFKPDSDRPISCIDCWKDRRQKMAEPRKMVQGNWSCSDCGNTISELPFEPSTDQPVTCKDCWRKKQA